MSDYFLAFYIDCILIFSDHVHILSSTTSDVRGVTRYDRRLRLIRNRNSLRLKDLWGGASKEGSVVVDVGFIKVY
jgi:hypothetical protein